MQQSIRYKGLSLTPDEMAVENGATSLCGNLELHDGALRPAIVSGTTLAQPLTDKSDRVLKLLYVHETGNYRHFITLGRHINNKQNVPAIFWSDKDGNLGTNDGEIFNFSEEVTVNSIDSVGNTLVVVASDGLHYALWKDDNYKYLGQKPPFIELGFSISEKDKYEDYDVGGADDAESSKRGFLEAVQQTTYGSSELFTIVKGISNFDHGKKCISVKEDKQSDVTQSVYALLNRTNNKVARDNRFYTNFYVRYCYRMFDGSMVMHSAPIFMPVMVPDNYHVSLVTAMFKREKSRDEETSDIYFNDDQSLGREDAMGFVKYMTLSKASFAYSPRNVALLYTLEGSIGLLQEWSDIITSIDIFITPPITNIDTSEKISSLKVYDYSYRLNRGLVKPTEYGPSNSYDYTGPIVVDFPTLTSEEYRNKLKNSSAFYKICSLKVKDLTEVSTATELPVEDGVIYQISLQEQMTDDYKTHNYLYANGSYVYNHRLNLYGMKERLFDGFSRGVMFPCTGKLFRWTGNVGDTPSDYFEIELSINKIVTVLNTNSGKKYVSQVIHSSNYKLEAPMITNMCKYYPDSRAEKMVIFTTNSSGKEYIFSFDLEACEEMNGAMHLGMFENDGKDCYDYLIDSFDYKEDYIVDMSNKIYTSESDNAFYFPLNGINTVGIGTIQGIASTTRALSQGQFGQYPLMAFSTDGIWAMEVSSQGTYSSIHPISREVCSNPKSITQLDQSVVFATNRSLSKIVESQVASLSDCLDGPGFDIANHLGKFLNFFSETTGDDDSAKTMKRQMRQLIGFTSSPIDFFQDCQVIYDYKNSRIFCLNVGEDTKAASADTVALCYSVKDDAWSSFLIKNVLTAINSYPHPYVQFRDGSVTMLDKGYDYDDDTIYHGIIVTRTLKFDEDTMPDSITGYIHSLTTSQVPVMWLYGSNDNQNWHYLGRLGGMKSGYMASHSYRYFRIALYLRMKSKNQYFATRLEVIRRFSKF